MQSNNDFKKPLPSLSWIVPLDSAGSRIDVALTLLPEIPTRSHATKLIRSGCIRHLGKVVKPSYIIKGGEELTIELPSPPPTELMPYFFPLDIIYEDEALLIVNKPAGLVVHPAYGHPQDTLVNALLAHTPQLSRGFVDGRPGLVHRIDKDTSGLLVVAKNDEAQSFLAQQFQRKTTFRKYYAIVYGTIKPGAGRIESFLRRHPNDRKRVASVKSSEIDAVGGKLAITHYQTLSSACGLSLVELKLETGRTHQIRVHLSELGHPIVGDNTYGAERRVKTLRSISLRNIIQSMTRFALHAAELGFVHPVSHENLTFRVGWPSDLLPLIEATGFPKDIKSE